MADFRALLQKPVDSIKKPPVLPIGTYLGVVTQREFGESSQKKTPYVRFSGTYSSAGEDIPVELMEGIDLSKKTWKVEYYITPDAEYRIVDLAKSCSIPTDGRTLEELINDMQGQSVQIGVIQDLNQSTSEPYNKVRDIRGSAA